ncbi:CBS domain-containing protein [Motiliproteus sediminis]|uniref:CBS domain-containing protein n=1 Tax=Motiliproteus sediminis TaxID=1468178 RepID=UPI001AEFEDE4|nr:CBS domain-containing protein [Motiliproteus sediminis]
MPLKVSNFMTAKVLTAQPDDGIRQTFFRMRESEVRHMPVVDEDRKLLGIISDRDLRRPEWVDEAPDLAHIYHLDDNLSVSDLMTRNVMVAHTYDTIAKATRILLEHRFGALPVLNKEQELVGMLSSHDLLKALDLLLSEQKAERKGH